LLGRFQLYAEPTANSRMLILIPKIKRNEDDIVDWRLRC
jgi:hypothetical protein